MSTAPRATPCNSGKSDKSGAASAPAIVEQSACLLSDFSYATPCNEWRALVDVRTLPEREQAHRDLGMLIEHYSRL
jgi:hypothetical protein